jgi:hypothetical protein
MSFNFVLFRTAILNGGIEYGFGCIRLGRHAPPMARSIGAARMHDLVLSEALFLISIPGRAPNDPRLIGLGVVRFLPAPVTCS